MARNVCLNMIGCCMVAMIFIIGATEATDYTVGDSLGWNVPNNKSFYTDWASTKEFFVNDTLLFNWTGNHTVRIDSEATYYDNCNTSEIGIQFRSSFRYTIVGAGHHYFVCTVGNHCERGQKFSINVESPPASAAPTLSFGFLSAPFLSTFALYIFSPPPLNYFLM
ncbi:cucumber peeling cupredoxin [Cajanus cajan]|uniref:Cucumber peeling cupredoxin n=1 Tax=Cajanus cajan TaxID=3821 RepID=A0A151RKX2_CAJCA|nr:cucumber peeling cupredoxin [Cajanus cajan]KYP43199.1 Cucumber peeling cupredoxin [Cajanus cajan]